MRGAGRVRGRICRGGHGQRRQQLSNEIRATSVDHVINRGLTVREAGQRVQPLTLTHFFLQFSFSVYCFVSIFLFTPM